MRGNGFRYRFLGPTCQERFCDCDSQRLTAYRKRRIGALMLSVFGDETADESKQRVFAVGGVIGSEKIWKSIEDKWVSRTQGVPFHAVDCDSDRGDYSNTSHQENKALYRDVTTLVAESGLGGYAFLLDLIALRKVFPDAPNFAYYRCFVEVIDKMATCAVKNNETVKFCFDMNRETHYNAAYFYSMMVKSPPLNRVLFGEISFICSKDSPRIQIGDLFTHEAMKALDNEIGPVKRKPRGSWMALRNSGRFHAEAVSDDWFNDLKRKMGVLQAQTGMNEEGYRKWISQKNRQDNMSNKFEYMQWTLENCPDKG